MRQVVHTNGWSQQPPGLRGKGNDMYERRKSDKSESGRRRKEKKKKETKLKNLKTRAKSKCPRR